MEKSETQRAAENLVNSLLSDLDDRSGFDTGMIDEETMAEWRQKWTRMVLDAWKEP